MAKMITRTIESATIKAMVANISTMSMEEKVFSFDSRLKKEADILADVKGNETDTEKIVAVKIDTIERTSAIYGMTEADFLKYAKKMETRFKMEADTVEAEETEAE